MVVMFLIETQDYNYLIMKTMIMSELWMFICQQAYISSTEGKDSCYHAHTANELF